MNMTRDTNIAYQSIQAYHIPVMRHGVKMLMPSDCSTKEVLVSANTCPAKAILKVLDVSDGEVRIPCFIQEEAPTHAWGVR